MDPQDIDAMISQHVEKRAADLKFVDPDNWIFPAQEFECKCGISGISREHTMPEGKSALDVALEVDNLLLKLSAIGELISTKGQNPGTVKRLEAALVEERKKILPGLSHIYRQLEALNPELNTLDFDKENNKQLTAAIYGIAAGFNVADIQFFLSGDWKKQDASSSAWGEKCIAITQRAGCALGFFPSPSTQNLILQKLHDREHKTKKR